MPNTAVKAGGQFVAWLMSRLIHASRMHTPSAPNLPSALMIPGARSLAAGHKEL
ncbi:hypothetical protein ABIE67_000534 [Streptomyces sp. V4I8]